MKKILVLLVVSAIWVPAQAADSGYPSRIVTIVVPVAAGGGTDTFARMIAQGMQKTSGQNFIIENRSGGGGTIGTAVVARAAPDGYTLLYSASSITNQNVIYPALTYNVERDFRPVVRPVSIPFVMAVHPSVPARNFKQLMALAKSKPGNINYGSSGTGSTSNLGMVMINRVMNVNMLNVNYRGAAPVLNAVMSGEISVALMVYPLVRLHLESGKLHAIAVTSAKRSSIAPNIPTIQESGVPGFEAIQWHGLFAPAKTPEAVVKWLHEETQRILLQPQMKERFAVEGADPVQESSADFAKFFSLEAKRWSELLKDLPTK